MSNRYIPEIWEKRLLKQLRPSFWDKMFGKRSRTWRERLFSWPWRPWRRWTWIERGPSGEANDVVRIRTKPDVTLDFRPDDVDYLNAREELRKRLEAELR